METHNTDKKDLKRSMSVESREMDKKDLKRSMSIESREMDKKDLKRSMSVESHETDKKDVRRPMNAFLIFCKRHRSMVREKNPDLDNRSVTRILGDLWANLGEDTKSDYTTLAKQYKDAFMKANPDYKWHNPDKVHAPPAKMATRPTNARVIKNDVEINLDGSIVPGKLADPSKMGGLSLLLMAGQQETRDRRTSETMTSPTEENSSTSKSALLELAEMCTNELIHDPEDDPANSESQNQTKNVKKLTLKSLESKLKSTKLANKSPLQSGEFEFSEPIDLSTKSPCEKDIKKVCHDEESNFIHQNIADFSAEQLNRFAQSKDVNIMSDVKHKLADLVKLPRELTAIIPNDKLAEVKLDKIKEELKTSKNPKYETDGESLSDQNDNDIVNCGKMVVEHIMDKLFSAQVENHLQEKTEKSCIENMSINKKSESHIDRVVSEIYKQTEVEPMDNSSLKSLQEDQENKTQGSTSKELNREADPDDTTEGDGSDSGGLKRPLQDDESQENDDMVPVRKSRRRNRGQRYQALINEGIIQPSKERLAARKAAKTTPDEESDGFEDYMVVEELVERKTGRKRMISEGEDGEDLKKYKTGDFDLEAHIADLPACSLDQLSKGKKNMVRSRHLSESSIKKSTTSIMALKEEAMLYLPPHVRLKSTEQQPENIVGSRRRKFRKHSINHLIPAKSVDNIPLPTGNNSIDGDTNKPERATVKVESSDVRGSDTSSDSDHSNTSKSKISHVENKLCLKHLKSEMTNDQICDHADIVSSNLNILDSKIYKNESRQIVDRDNDLEMWIPSESCDNGVHALQEKSTSKKPVTPAKSSESLRSITQEHQSKHTDIQTCDSPTLDDLDKGEVKPDLIQKSDIKLGVPDKTELKLNSENFNDCNSAGEDKFQDSNFQEKNFFKLDVLCESDVEKRKGKISDGCHIHEQSEFNNSSIECVNVSAAAVRMEILAAEVQTEDTNPSMQCQGSSSVTAVHS